MSISFKESKTGTRYCPKPRLQLEINVINDVLREFLGHSEEESLRARASKCGI
jgi:hypothetical protein